MQGVRRVITFCILTAVIPTFLIILPLYLRHHKYADVVYKVSESDVIQIHDGQSSFFCQAHTLKMNSSFHAFQMRGTPEISNSRKHIRLKKSMSLPDDTLEYWGFFMLKGATVELHGCSRYEGASLLVVKGDNVLDTCGILEDKINRYDPLIAKNHGNVVVTIESPAELVDNMNHPKGKREHVAIINDDNTGQETSAEMKDELTHLRQYIVDRIGEQEKHHHIKINQNESPLSTLDKADSIATDNNQNNLNRTKRDVAHTPHHLLDRKVTHGGNAANHSDYASVSSFENNLFQCYDGDILKHESIPFSMDCINIQSLEKTTTLRVTHDVYVDGYYYYIFYSDNDLIQNDIHLVFDIYKPTFQFANLSSSKVCINQTFCEFPVGFLSEELVIIEVPTKDGIEHEGDDITYLISTCQPRTAVYIVFPVAMLLFILLCAFL